jgi:hypothetical protein
MTSFEFKPENSSLKYESVPLFTTIVELSAPSKGTTFSTGSRDSEILPESPVRFLQDESNKTVETKRINSINL